MITARYSERIQIKLNIGQRHVGSSAAETNPTLNSPSNDARPLTQSAASRGSSSRLWRPGILLTSPVPASPHLSENKIFTKYFIVSINYLVKLRPARSWADETTCPAEYISQGLQSRPLGASQGPVLRTDFSWECAGFAQPRLAELTLSHTHTNEQTSQ